MKRRQISSNTGGCSFCNPAVTITKIGPLFEGYIFCTVLRIPTALIDIEKYNEEKYYKAICMKKPYINIPVNTLCY